MAELLPFLGSDSCEGTSRKGLWGKSCQADQSDEGPLWTRGTRPSGGERTGRVGIRRSREWVRGVGTS